MVKAYCGEFLNEVIYTCLQFHGRMGYMRQYDRANVTLRATRSVHGGTTDVMLEEVAKRMCYVAHDRALLARQNAIED